MKKGLGKGRTFARGEAGFDEAVLETSFNAHDPGRRPDYVCQANDVPDVVDAVKLAGREKIKVSVCSGGHSWSQNHIRDGGMMIDLARVSGIEIDAAGRKAIVGPGCHGGDLDVALARHGLFFPVGHAYSIGMGGFLLQGGFGWNGRILGLSCESVEAIDVVLADGRIVHASETQNSDLLWAARGAGAGFFGIVVRFYLKLYDRPQFIGVKLQVFRIAHMEDVMTWADAIGQRVPAQVEFTVIANRKALGIFTHGIEVLVAVFADNRRQANQYLSFLKNSPVRRKASLTLPLIKLSLNTLMKAGEKAIFFPNVRWFADNVWIKSPIKPVLGTLRRIVDTQPGAPSHFAWMNWLPRNRPRLDMAFSMEGTGYIGLYGALKKGAGSAADENWATDNAHDLQKHGIGSQLGDENLARRVAVFMAPENAARLAQIRDKYDPEDRLHNYGHLPDGRNYRQGDDDEDI